MLDSINDIFKTIVGQILVPLMNDGQYLKGFLVGLMVAFGMGLAARLFLFDRARILVFFATVQPSLKPSPSGFARMWGCIISIIRLAVLLAGSLLLLSGLLRACAAM